MLCPVSELNRMNAVGAVDRRCFYALCREIYRCNEGDGMYRKSTKLAVVLFAMGFLGGCVSESGVADNSAASTETLIPAVGVETTPAVEATDMPELSKVDVNLAPLQWMQVEWDINVDDPAVVSRESHVVVAGTVVSTDSVFVDPLGEINTRYTIKVDKVYKGDVKVGDDISVSLLGGTMLAGDYIDEVERLGLTERVFSPSSTESDPKAINDPRDNDPNSPIMSNWGSNPTSESLNAELKPDAWVYFLKLDDDSSYYGSFANHSLKYVKDGYIYNLNPENDGGQTIAPFPEAELGE